MVEVKVLAGDFAQNGTPGSYMGGVLLLPAPGAWIANEQYFVRNDVVTLELANETAGVKVFGAAAWGAAGAMVAGPLGMLAGAILGGRGENVAFVAEFCDGKRLMAQCDKKAWTQMLADRFMGPDPEIKPRAERASGTWREGLHVMLVILAIVGMGWFAYSCANA